MRLKITIALVLVAATLLVFWQAGNHDFFILDDQLYVSKNPAIQGGLTMDGIRWAFTDTETTGNWHPLTWISHMLDIQLFGIDPAGHHLVNVGLHAANTLLLFLVLCTMTGALWRSAVVAALFALHPLHVESVAWIAERKDVLSTFFWMLTLLFYAGYVRRPGTARYLATFAAFLLGLMAKPMLVTLPFVLLLLDYWPLGRFGGGPETPLPRASGGAEPAPAHEKPLRRLVLEKLPFLAISAIFCAVAIHAQHRGGYVPSFSAYPLPLRIYNALLAYVGYLAKFLWPLDLAVFYPFPRVTSIWPAIGSAVLLIGISLPAAWHARRRPYLPVGWLWFLGTLVPVIGLVQVGRQSMADRYMYIPLVGLAIMAVWGVSGLFPTAPRRTAILGGTAGIILLACAAMTRRQLAYWQNSVTLLEHTLRVTPPNYFVQGILGNALFQQGRFEEALPHYREAVRIHPAHAMAYYRIGTIMLYRQDIDQAIRNFSAALTLDPSDDRARRELERCLAIQGRTGEH